MRIGIFDSGLGGLIIARAIRKMMPEYDYVYLGDTKRVPYGNRSHDAVYQFTKEAVDYLFKKENCAIVIIACNTASARALRQIQQEYKNLENKKVLGVLIPAVEKVINFKKVGVIGTNGTISSQTFVNEIKKINPRCKVFQNSAPMLVPLVEEGENSLAKPFLIKYLKPLLDKGIEALILGCTHYPIFKKEIKKIVGKNIKIISQDEIVPKKLKNYFERHGEIKKSLTKIKKQTPNESKASYGARILVTDMTQNVSKLSKKWFGNIKPRLVKI